MQQKPTSSTQTSHQQMSGTAIMSSSGGSSQQQTPQSNQQSQQENNSYFTTSADTQLTDSQQMTSAAISSASPVQISQNGYSTSISNSSVQSTQSFNQSQCIGGAQTAWRGSSTVTYTPSVTMQPSDNRPVNQQYCKFLIFTCIY